MATKKHNHSPQKPQQPRKKNQHLPKVGSPQQHAWDEKARGEVVEFGMWWVVGAVVLAALIGVLIALI